MVAAYRAADAVAFTYGAYDLSARLIGLRHGAARIAHDSLTDAHVAYVSPEIYVVARAHAQGLSVFQQALDAGALPCAGAAPPASDGAVWRPGRCRFVGRQVFLPALFW